MGGLLYIRFIGVGSELLQFRYSCGILSLVFLRECSCTNLQEQIHMVKELTIYQGTSELARYYRIQCWQELLQPVHAMPSI